MHHARLIVRVQRRLDVLGLVDPDVLRDRHEDAVVVDVQQLVDVELLGAGGREAEHAQAPLDLAVLRLPRSLAPALRGRDDARRRRLGVQLDPHAASVSAASRASAAGAMREGDIGPV